MESSLRCRLCPFRGLVSSFTSTCLLSSRACFTSYGPHIAFYLQFILSIISITFQSLNLTMVPSTYLLSVLTLAATVFAGPLPISNFCETNSCAKALLQHPALSHSFCQKYEMNSRYPWHPSQSELLVRPPIPNHPLYAAACFDAEDYADGLPKACNCVPR
jgi:hypothetical protein